MLTNAIVGSRKTWNQTALQTPTGTVVETKVGIVSDNRLIMPRKYSNTSHTEETGSLLLEWNYYTLLKQLHIASSSAVVSCNICFVIIACARSKQQKCDFQ